MRFLKYFIVFILFSGLEAGYISADVKKNSADAEIYYNKGNAYYAKGEYKHAISEYSKVIEINPKDDIYFNRGLAYYHAGKYDSAISDYSKAIELNPKYAAAYYNRANAYHSKWDYNRAVADYKKAKEIDSSYTNTYFENLSKGYAKKGENNYIDGNNNLADILYTNQGKAYASKGDYDRAIAEYNKAIEANPRYGRAYYNRGNAYIKKGSYDQAIADFSKAIEINPRDADNYYRRGIAYNWKGQYDSSIADLNKVIEINPGNAEAYYSRGYAYNGKGQYAHAITNYSKAVELNSGYAYAYYGRGIAYYSKGEYDRAISDYNSAIELSPKYAKAYYGRGNSYYMKGEYDRAIADYDKSIELDPGFANAYTCRKNAYAKKSERNHTITEQKKAQEYYDIGNEYCRKGEYDRAITDYSKAININPKFAEAYNNRGNAYFEKGEYDLAILDYNKAIEINPNFASTNKNRAIAYAKKAERDRAVSEQKKAVAYFDSGNTHYTKGNYDRAIDDYSNAIEINPKYAEAYNARATAYHSKNEFDHAIADYRKAKEINSKYTNTYFESFINVGEYCKQGNDCYDKGEYDRAIEYYTKAIELNPKFAQSYNNRGNAYYKKGEYDRAISDYNRALEIDSRYIEAYNNRGNAYFKMGNYDCAIEDYNKAVIINPNYTQARKNREIAYVRKRHHERLVFLTIILCSSIPPTIGLGVGLYFIFRKKAKYCQRYLEKAKLAFDNKDYDRAQKLYEKIIKILALKKPAYLAVSLKKILGEAYLGLGRIYEKKKNPSSAANFYDKALNIDVPVSSLPDTAIILLGNMYADDTDRSRIAVEVYIKFILLEPMSKDTEKVYSILEGLCRIDENLDADSRGYAMTLNKKVVESNPDVEWAHFYLSVGSFLNNDLQNAQKYLSLAIKQNSGRALSYYWLGMVYLKLNKIYNAAEQFYVFIKQICSDNPDRETQKQAEAYFYIGKSLVKTLGDFSEEIDLSIKGNYEKLEKALQYFEQAAVKDNSKADYFFHIARVLSLLGKTEEAISVYQKATELDNKNSNYFYLLAKELKKIGNYEDAKEKIIAAISISDLVEYRKLLAELYFITRKFKDAEDECRKVFEVTKDFDSETLGILIHALYHQSKYSDVIDTCEKYHQKNEIGKTTNDTVFCMARSYSKLSKFEEAIGWYKQLLEIEERQDAWYYLGCAFAHKEKFDEALTAFHKVVGSENQYVALACLQCGHVFFRTGKIKEAEESYQRAYLNEPGNVDVLYALGSFYYDVGNDDKALNYLTEVVKANPEYALAHFTLGLIHEKKGNVEQAIAGYEKALTGETTSLKSHLRLGIMCCRQSEYEKAVQHLQKVYQSGDRSDTVLFYLGLASSHNGQGGMVLEAWNELRKRHPDDSRLASNIYKYHYITGCRRVEENKYLDAIPEWEEYLKRHTEDTKTQKDLAELYLRSCISEMNNGDINKAKKHILRAVELDGNSENYVFYSGLCDFNMGNYTGCISLFSKLQERQPDNTRFKYHLGLSLLKNNEKEKAMKIFDDLSRKEERDVYSNYAASIIANEYIKEGKHSEGARILASLV